MNFYQVLYHMNQHSCPAYRASWNKNTYIILQKPMKKRVFTSYAIQPNFVDDDNIEPSEPRIMLIQPNMYFEKICNDLSEIGWKPSVEDLLADDWEEGD